MFTSKMLKISSFIPSVFAATLGFVSTGCQAGFQNQAGLETSPIKEFVHEVPSLALDSGCVRIQRGANREVADTRISKGQQDKNYGLDPSARVGAVSLRRPRFRALATII